ncbi:flagellar assembly protein FliW [Virgibacillus pantothenticus]|nr:flagellar assembly protein FliW [Virgibacillus pantothenticus]MEB5468762.1 flagellar assembly protein FliW [Virgibacillus pantothenticus]
MRFNETDGKGRHDMRMDTKYFGEVDIVSTSIIHFPTGVLGFQQETEFVLLDFPNPSIFQILQSTKSKETAFIVINPYHMYPDYTFKLDESTVQALQLIDESDIMVLSIVTLKEPFKDSTMNLQAPIIINASKLSGKQFVINTNEYMTRAPITISDPLMAKGE